MQGTGHADRLIGGGQMWALMRSIDWSKTSLGVVEGWPPCLRTAVDIVIAGGVPMMLLGGPENIVVYNDACRSLLGVHDVALGQPFLEKKDAFRAALEPFIARARQGETTTESGVPLPFERQGHGDHAWCDISCSPIADETGAVASVLVVMTEATARVLAERRRDELEAELGEREAIEGGDTNALYQQIVDAALLLMRADAASLQALDPRRKELRLVVSVGFEPEAAKHWKWVRADSTSGCGIALAAGARAIIPDIESFEPLAGTEDLVFFRLCNVRAVQSTPLVSRSGRPIGMLSTLWREPHRPSEGELQVVDVLARQAADLVERRFGEDLLRASEERLRQAISIDTVGVIFFGSKGRISDANDAFLRMSGSTREEVQRGLVRWDFPAEATPYEKEYVRNDGSRWWGLFAAKRIDEDQNVAFILDVTQRKEAEARVREGEERRAFLLDLGDRLRPHTDAGEIMAAVSVALREHLGAARAVYREVDGAEILYTTDQQDPRFSAATRLRMSDYGANLLEQSRAGLTVVIPDVETAPLSEVERSRYAALSVRAFVSVPMVKKGQLVAFLTVQQCSPRAWTVAEVALIEEVAERTWAAVERARAEVALRESEERFRALVEPWAQATWEADASGIMTGDAADRRALLGQTLDEWREQGWARLIHPEDRGYAIALWREAVFTATPVDAEVRLLSADRQWRWVNVHAVPLCDSEGAVRKWVGVNIDITDRKEALEGLRQASRAKDEFLAILAHELRNPLAPLSNGLEIIRLAPNDRQAVEQARSMMARQLSQMVRLTDDLLDVSRISRGTVELRRESVELGPICRQAAETSRPWMDANDNELTIDVPAQPVFLHADAARLAQVFANLLNNAAKYSPRGSPITLAAERTHEGIVIRIRDAGVGIPPEMLPRVFDMFMQVDPSLAKAQGGLGVGLSLVRGLVELHGGTVEAYSEGPGRGSEFVVRLPVLSSTDAVSPPERDEAIESSVRRRVLIVDDNRDAATSLAVLLNAMNYETQTAFDGVAALDVADAFRPEVVLLDIGMPLLDGYDTCRELRRQPWGRDIVIGALTGWGRDKDNRRSEEAGFDFHLVKPAEVSTLTKLLTTLPVAKASLRG